PRTVAGPKPMARRLRNRHHCLVPTILPALTELAISAYRANVSGADAATPWLEFTRTADPILDALFRRSASGSRMYESDEVRRVADALSADPEFADLLPRQGELEPMILTARGGGRVSFEGLMVS